MYVGYYLSDRYPLPQNQGGPFNAYPGSPFLCAQSQSKADTLAYYRPNQAMNRVYMHGLGDVNAIPTSVYLFGAAAIAAAWLFSKGGKKL